jgi:hypothetical protein
VTARKLLAMRGREFTTAGANTHGLSFFELPLSPGRPSARRCVGAEAF